MGDAETFSDATLDALLGHRVSLELDDAGEAGWRQHNSLFNEIANMQRIPPGSWSWWQAGVAAFSGQSGPHGSYGWKHDHRMGPEFARAVIANYGHRRNYYTGAKFRQWGYEAGGRPHGWRPEIPGDNPNGTADYFTAAGIVTVSGPDAEHLWLEPLWAVLDSPAVQIKIPGDEMSSRALAGVMVTMQLRSAMGMIRNQETGMAYPWSWGDRANSRILGTFIEAMARGAIEPDDVATGLQWIATGFLPFYEQVPGISKFGSSPDERLFPVSCYNGIYWLLPVCYRATQVLANVGLVERFKKIVQRLSQWALDIEEAIPGRGFDAATFLIDAAWLHTGPTPRATLKPMLFSSNISFPGNEVWSYRACDVAAETLGSPFLRAARQELLARHANDFSKKQWIVTKDGDYAIYHPTEIQLSRIFDQEGPDSVAISG